MVNGLPGAGGEVDAVVIPGVVVVGQSIDLICDVIVGAEDVLDVAGFGEIEDSGIHC